MKRWLGLLFGIVVFFPATRCSAQQVQVQSPLQSLNHSYHESFRTQWSLGGPRWFFNSGNGPVVPFGQPELSGGLQGGMGFQNRRGIIGQLGLSAAQGSQTSFSGSAPSLMVTSGVPGYFFSGQFSPFVIGIRPVVGNWTVVRENTLHTNVNPQPAPPPVEDDQAVVRERRQKEQTKLRNAHQIHQYLLRAERARDQGNLRLARINYQKALRRAAPEQKAEIQQNLRDLVSTNNEDH